MIEIEQQARSIFLQALELTADRRSAFLEQCCALNLILRSRVDRLLASHTQLGSVPAQPVQPLESDADFEESIGNYRLLNRIGEGGFGNVYSAQQTHPARLVAIKLLKRGMDSQRVVARFESERQVLAMMDHPNIATIYDAGVTASGRPYFAMELVEGVSITEFCDAKKLSIRQRVAMFLDVCVAIQHAHQKGIIHRDLKPTNILVSQHDATPIVKVIDFGIAKAIGEPRSDQVQHTAQHELLGTPCYMSPEQASDDYVGVDTRSDVYSLGVVLYELLSGSTPLNAARNRAVGPIDERRMVRQLEPLKPSSSISIADNLPSIAARRSANTAELAGLLKGELDWIILKTLETDRNRRYETVNAFAQDLGRYLNDEPVTACPPSTLYQLGKFARRYRQTLFNVSVVTAAFVAIVAIMIANSIQMIRTSAALKVAKNDARSKNYLDALAELGRAEQELHRLASGKTRRVLDDFVPKAIELRNEIDAPELQSEIDYGIRTVWLKAQAAYDIDESAPIELGERLQFRPNVVAVHPSGRVVVVAGKTHPHLIQRDSPNREIPGSEILSLSSVWYSPSGKWIAMASTEGEVSLWDESASNCVGRWKPKDVREVSDVAFSEEEKSLMLIDHDGVVRQLAIPNLTEVDTLDYAMGDVTRIPVTAAFSRDASRLAIADAEGNVTVSDHESVLAHFSLPRRSAYNLTWSWDATLIAANTTDRVVVIPVDGSSFPREFPHGLAPVPDRATITSHSRLLISSGMIWDLDAGQAVLSTAHVPVGVSSDGKTIVCIGQGITFCTIKSPAVAHACYGHQSSVVQCTWSMNSRRFATIDNSFVLCVWEAEQGRLLYRVQLPQGDFFPDNGGLALSHDGKFACIMYRLPDLTSCAYIIEVDQGRLSQPFQLPVSGFFRAAFRPSENDFLGVCEDLQSDNRVNTTTLSVSIDGKVELGQVIRRSADGERRFLDHKLSSDGHYYAWIGPRLPADGRRLETLDTSLTQRPPILNMPLVRSAEDLNAPGIRMSLDFKHLYLVQKDRIERIDVFEKSNKSIALTNLAAASDDEKWMLCSTDGTPQSMQRPVTLNLHKFGMTTPWIGFHRDGESGEFQGGSAHFSPDGNWAIWGKSVGGRLSVVDLQALEAGAEELLKR